MGKKERLQRRVKRIDDRFKVKVAKGKKGTDSDIQNHENRIERLAKKGGFTAPFMSKSPLKELGEVHIGNPNETPDGKKLGPTKIGNKLMEPHMETITNAANAINSGDEGAIENAINTKLKLTSGGKGRTSTGAPISVPSFTTTVYDATKESGLIEDE